MYKRYYDGYGRVNNAAEHGEIVVPQCLESEKNEKEVSSQITASNLHDDISECSACGKSFLNLPFEIDDIILIGILLFLLLDKDRDDCDDDNNNIFILLIIGFIIFSDIF